MTAQWQLYRTSEKAYIMVTDRMKMFDPADFYAKTSPRGEQRHRAGSCCFLWYLMFTYYFCLRSPSRCLLSVDLSARDCKEGRITPTRLVLGADSLRATDMMTRGLLGRVIFYQKYGGNTCDERQRGLRRSC